jgi:predicted RNA methylase
VVACALDAARWVTGGFDHEVLDAGAGLGSIAATLHLDSSPTWTARSATWTPVCTEEEQADEN